MSFYVKDDDKWEKDIDNKIVEADTTEDQSGASAFKNDYGWKKLFGHLYQFQYNTERALSFQ